MTRRMAVVVLILFFAGCASSGWRDFPRSAAQERMFYLTGHGWHVGLVLPAAYPSPLIERLRLDLGDAPYYEIGWGDERFYRAEEPSFDLAVRAALGSTGSVIHAVALPVAPRAYFSHAEVIEARVAAAGYRRMVEFVEGSFDPQHAATLGPGLYGRSRFYRAVGEYSLGNTCNTWTARALERTGMPVDGEGTRTAGRLLRQVREAMESYRGAP